MAHCYRMMGSLEEAEDLVQETLARAWRGRANYEGRAPFRTWLYSIATNLCLDALKRHPRRMLPVSRAAAASVDEPIPAGIDEPLWLEPCPDSLLEMNDPETHLTSRERVSMAFMISLHLLPPRQRAVLILRDVLDLPAADVAGLLGQSVASVKSALHRARATMESRQRDGGGEPCIPRLDSGARGWLERYMRAWERADVDELMALLKEDASFSMPPIPSWYQGRETIGKLVAKTIFRGDAAGRWRLVPARANGQIAFGLYRLNDANGGHDFYAIQVLTLDGESIADITTCRNPRLARFFELPERLASK
jgi:RNA polymerase sigma-70 factor (ECF subfamily)